MSTNPVDKVFDTFYIWYTKAANKGVRVLENIKELKSTTTTEPIVKQQVNANTLIDHLYAQRYKILPILGISASALLIWTLFPRIIHSVPTHLKECDRQCVLVLGHLRDPITRHVVMDLYRRGFTVCICSENCGDQNDDEGLFHIEHSELNKFINLLNEKSLKLTSILLIPNSAYYPSGLFTNLSNSSVQFEFEQNIMKPYRVLTKLLPHFNYKIQIILLSPSLPQNFGIPHHSPEILIAGMVRSLYTIISTEYSTCDTYLCHLGLLQIAANPSNYKYLSTRGSNINKSLLEPLFRLILSKSSRWLTILEFFRGHQRFYGRGSLIGYYFGSWLPVSILNIF